MCVCVYECVCVYIYIYIRDHMCAQYGLVQNSTRGDPSGT